MNASTENTSGVSHEQMPTPEDARNAYWSDQAEQYRAKWDRPHPEAALYKELEAKLLIDGIGIQPGMMVLDLCCGTGRNSVALAKAGASVIGLDGAEGMLAQARSHAAQCGIESIEFRQGDCRELPFDDNSFDGITGTRFMYMMTAEDKRRIASEIHRVLKPGGRAAIQFNSGFRGIKHELQNLIVGRRFRLKDRYLWPGQAKKIFDGFEINEHVGVKLPFLARFARVVGRRNALRVNSLCRFFPFRHLTAYAVVIVTCRK